MEATISAVLVRLWDLRTLQDAFLWGFHHPNLHENSNSRGIAHHYNVILGRHSLGGIPTRMQKSRSFAFSQHLCIEITMFFSQFHNIVKELEDGFSDSTIHPIFFFKDSHAYISDNGHQQLQKIWSYAF